MIRDYKFDPALDSRARRRGRGRLLIFAILLLTAIVLMLRLTGPAQAPESLPSLVEQSLENSTEPSAGDAPQISQPLALPDMPALPPQAPASAQVGGAEPAIEAQPSLLSPTKAAELPAEQPVESATTSLADEPPVEIEPEMRAQWLSHTIAPGESLARIFKARNLSANLLHRIVNSSKQAKELANIRPGQELRFLLDDEDGLEQLVLVKSPIESLHIRAIDDNFETELLSKSVDKRIASAAGTIQSSLFVDGQKAGLSDAQIMELAALFGWDVDFALEIRAGDQFRLLYEEQYLDGEKFRNGPILAAEFVNKGKTYQAFRFEDNKGEVGYYDAEGRNKRRAFIRTPIKFARVSSRFTTKRWHPVLKKWRSHKGVDYAAPTGTPIKATGAGKVIFRGWKGGYGRVVIVQHANKYRTLYAHMSKFSSRAKAGKRVKQGQIVGYVGKSGLATGPHLHYEFQVNGVHRNPLTVKLPKSLPLPKQKLADFKKQTASLVSQLESIAQPTMVASQ